VPPSVVGIVDGANYSNSVEESRALVQRCLLPMSRRIESAMNSQLLTPESRKAFTVEHVLDGITRGDLVQRYNAYAVGRNGGWLNVNQIRAFENMSNIGPAGDTYSEPLNMGIVGANDNRNKIDESKVA
jgi:phage portal protein BeeE